MLLQTRTAAAGPRTRHHAGVHRRRPCRLRSVRALLHRSRAAEVLAARQGTPCEQQQQRSSRDSSISECSSNACPACAQGTCLTEVAASKPSCCTVGSSPGHTLRAAAAVGRYNQCSSSLQVLTCEKKTRWQPARHPVGSSSTAHTWQQGQRPVRMQQSNTCPDCARLWQTARGTQFQIDVFIAELPQ
jgi:hypothetical protein